MTDFHDAKATVDDHLAAVQWVDTHIDEVLHVGRLLCDSFAGGHKLLTFGNGGSAADAQHLAAEFVGRFKRERRALPAIALTTDPSIVTCIANDYSYDEVFARPVTALAQPGDIVIGFTTSGRSPSVVNGLRAARAAGATAVLVSAGDGGPAAAHADHRLLVKASQTARIQEAHLLILHMISEVVDVWAAEQTQRAFAS
jgi:D-sedoheptulose 7-phosphate isomerase